MADLPKIKIVFPEKFPCRACEIKIFTEDGRELDNSSQIVFVNADGFNRIVPLDATINSKEDLGVFTDDEFNPHRVLLAQVQMLYRVEAQA